MKDIANIKKIDAIVLQEIYILCYDLSPELFESILCTSCKSENKILNWVDEVTAALDKRTQQFTFKAFVFHAKYLQRVNGFGKLPYWRWQRTDSCRNDMI